MTSNELDQRRRALRRATPAAVAIAAFAMMAALFVAGPRPLYDGLLHHWGIDPWAFPFLDTDTILSALRCRRMGVDIFVTNPCDPLGRVFDYSPLWLAGAVFPVTSGWIGPVGLSFVALFLAALFLLPPGRGWRATLIVTLGAVSSACMYAVERGNNDLVVFALGAATAALASRRGAWRTLGYGCALLAGLLKYYPLALLATALREWPGRFGLVAAAALGAIAVFAAAEGAELARALRLIPTGPFFNDMFGAKTLPGGLGWMFGLPPGAVGGLEAVLLAGAAAIGMRLGSRSSMRGDLERLTEPERMFLLVGSLLLIACFATAQNIGYRASLIVLLLPGLTALGGLGQRPNLFGVSAGVALIAALEPNVAAAARHDLGAVGAAWRRDRPERRLAAA